MILSQIPIYFLMNSTISTLITRNSSCEPSVRDFQGEISARNPFLKKYADLGITHICALLDSNNSPRESRNILSIREHDDESRQFHNVLTNFAKRICDNLCEKYGPSSSKYINNDFISWINISATKTNTKGLYEKILKCTYASSNLTAIKKLSKTPYIGTLNENRICGAMRRISKAVNTSRMSRASIEFCLGAFRSNIEVAIFTQATQQTCFCCGVLEKYNATNETGRSPIFHLLFGGAPARFLRNYLKHYARRILDQSFDITLSAILFNEVPFHIVKRCDNQSVRGWFTIINIYKTTLYALYYRRPLFDRSGSIIIRTFNHHLRAAKKAADERCSDILNKITYIPERDDSVIPFYKILNDTHYDTASFRRKDNKDFCFLSDYRKRLSRSKNFKVKQNTSKISGQKRQLLIENAFKKNYKLTVLSQTQNIDLCRKV